jgi:hypothetical protein
MGRKSDRNCACSDRLMQPGFFTSTFEQAVFLVEAGATLSA